MKKIVFYLASDGNKSYYMKGCRTTDYFSSNVRMEETVTSIDKDGIKGTERYLKIFRNIVLMTEITEREYELNVN